MLTHTSAFVVELERLLPARRQEPMSRHTTFQIGGPADYYAQAQTVAQLRSVGALAHREGVPLFIIGAGSNLLVSDAGIAGLVVETWSNDDPLAQHPPQTDPDNPTQRVLRVYSGVPLPRLALRAAAAGLTGLEWAVGIPGTVGGGVVNNAGAHGSQMADIVRSVLVLDAQGERWVPQEELGYGYRTSNFRTQWVAGAPPPVVLAAELALTEAAPAAIQQRIQEYTAHRKATQPSQRSIGSIFKNPPRQAAGWYLDQAGLKGAAVGDAQISTKHANFIVNRGKATAAQVTELMAVAQQRVGEVFGVRLEPEIQPVGRSA